MLIQTVSVIPAKVLGLLLMIEILPYLLRTPRTMGIMVYSLIWAMQDFLNPKP